MAVDAVILAGRANTAKLAGESAESFEANIDIAGKPMIEYILDALAGVPRIGRIYLVGPKDALGRYASDKVRLLPPGSTLLDNIKIGLAAAETEFVLVCASDIPLVTSDILDELLDRCLETGADFCYPVSRKEDCERAFPGVKRTYAILKEGTFTGGNVFFVRKAVVERSWPLVERMIAFRKNPLKMAGVLGVGLLAKLLAKTASVSDFEKRVGAILEMKPKAILNARPEIGVDVDKPSDLELCRRILAK